MEHHNLLCSFPSNQIFDFFKRFLPHPNYGLGCQKMENVSRIFFFLLSVNPHRVRVPLQPYANQASESGGRLHERLLFFFPSSLYTLLGYSLHNAANLLSSYGIAFELGFWALDWEIKTTYFPLTAESANASTTRGRVNNRAFFKKKLVLDLRKK